MSLRRPASLLLAAWVCAAGPAFALTVRLPLDPATLGGATIFAQAEQLLAQAAQAAGISLASDPRPLPPQVILTLDTDQGDAQKRNGLLFWRGDMLPDQLAPGETGALIRKRPVSGGGWKTVRVRRDFLLAAHTNFVPVAVFELPTLIIETPYQIGILGDAPARLVLWRSAEEDSAPLSGFIALDNPPAALLEALRPLIAPFDAQASWAAKFDALSP